MSLFHLNWFVLCFALYAALAAVTLYLLLKMHLQTTEAFDKLLQQKSGELEMRGSRAVSFCDFANYFQKNLFEDIGLNTRDLDVHNEVQNQIGFVSKVVVERDEDANQSGPTSLKVKAPLRIIRIIVLFVAPAAILLILVICLKY